MLRPEESHGKTMARQNQMDMAVVVQMMMQMWQNEREREDTRNCRKGKSQ